jgi:hypothetical protein
VHHVEFVLRARTVTYTSQQQAEFAYSAMSRRLKVIGVPLAYCIGRMSQSIRRRA